MLYILHCFNFFSFSKLYYLALIVLEGIMQPAMEEKYSLVNCDPLQALTMSIQLRGAHWCQSGRRVMG